MNTHHHQGPCAPGTSEERANYLLLLNGGSVQNLRDYTEESAKRSAINYALTHGPTTLVKVIGKAAIVAQWVGENTELSG